MTDQCAWMAADPQGWLGQEPSVEVPYHTMSTRPGSPAGIHGKRFVCRLGVAALTRTGFPQCGPGSVETARYIWLEPLMFLVESTEAFDLLTYRLPPRSMALGLNSWPHCNGLL